jgi:Co/Zn/Cd efflux system component
MGDLIEKRADGTTVVYIAFWRYCFLAAIFAGALYILVCTFLKLYYERLVNFCQHWSQTAGLMLGAAVVAIAVTIFAYWMLKGFYKKVQLEIGRSGLRYLVGGVRGGVLLSDNYDHISYPAITGIEIDQQFLVNRVIIIRTVSKTHKIVLLLSESEKMRCLDAIQEAAAVAKKRRP